jgi:hypothetical protein
MEPEHPADAAGPPSGDIRRTIRLGGPLPLAARRQVLAADWTENKLQLLDVDTAQVEAAGSAGAGPGEWRNVGPLLAGKATQRGCTTSGIAGSLVILPSGRADQRSPFEDDVGSRCAGFFSEPRAVDRQGRFHHDLAGIMAQGAQ